MTGFWDPVWGRFPGFSGRDLKKIYLGPPFQFFSKIFEKNINGDQGDFFQFFQKLIKKITLLSARDFFCTALPSNRWVHVAVTRQGTNGTLYINGQVVTSWFVFISPNSLNASGLTAQNCIGHSQLSTDPYLHGIVDDFRFYYYALNQSQIAVLAQQLDIYLAFDESSGNTSADSSGNGNTASLIGNVTFIPGKTNNAIKLFDEIFFSSG